MGSPEVPSDVVFNTLTQITSLQLLDTCKVVSTEWKKMTYESSFTSIHCERTKIKSGYFIQDIRHCEYVSKFVSCDSTLPTEPCVPKKVRILACAANQGILCCEKELAKQQSRYYVWIPVTREWRALPNPKIRYLTTATGIIVLRSHPLRFKIIRLSRRRGTIEPLNDLSCYRVEIFDSEARCWMEEQEDVMFPYLEFICINPAVTASNSLHWLTTEDNVLSYDVANNSFEIFSLPKPVKEDADSYTSKYLTEYEGRIGFTCLTRRGDIDLWTMDDIRIRSWKKEKSVNIDSLGEVAMHPSPAGFYNSDIAFLMAFLEVGFYKLQDGGFQTVKLDISREVFRFRSDVEPAHLSLK